MGRYRLSRAAASDVAGIRDHSRGQWGEETAMLYITKLRDRMRWLAEAPVRGRERGDLGEGLLSFPQGSHVIFYRPAAGGIQVVRVPHQRMDAAGHLRSGR